MNKVRENKIDRLILSILEKCNVNKLPIDVNKIAEKYNIEIKLKPYDGNDDLSGVLLRESEQTIIGVNANHPETRQRFTIAHEIGHFLLHEGDPLFIDKKYFVNYRHSTATDGANAKEIEANNFAGMLLIPTRFLEKDLNEESVDILDAKAIEKLSKKYNVSDQAMSIRLARM